MTSTGPAIRDDEWKIITDLVLDGNRDANNADVKYKLRFRRHLFPASSCHTRRAYSQALEEFLIWFRDEPNRQFNFSKATVQKYRTELETKGLAPSSISVRLSAIRRLALAASDNGRLDPDLAVGISRAKGAKQSGVRLGHWLTTERAQALLAAPDLTTPPEVAIWEPSRPRTDFSRGPPVPEICPHTSASVWRGCRRRADRVSNCSLPRKWARMLRSH
jgi:hypothetical protein